MSKPQKPRANAKKTTKTAEVIVETPTQPQPIAEPVVEPVSTPEPSVEPVVDAVKTPKEPARVLIVNISVARTRRHLDKLNLNMALDAKLNEHKKELALLEASKALLESKSVSVSTIVESVDANGKTTKTKTDQVRPASEQELADATTAVERITPTVASHNMHVLALTRERTRFSFNAPVVLSIVCDEMIESLLGHTMDKAIAGGKKIIQISHLHEAGIESLALYPLFEKLPSFQANSKKIAAATSAAKAQAHDAALLSQAEKDFKKKYAACLPKVQKAPKGEKPAVEVKPEEKIEEKAVVEEKQQTDQIEADSDDSKAAFKQYVNNICKILKESTKYASHNVKFSNEIRSYLSDLVAEFIRRVSGLVAPMISNMKIKTVNEATILRIVEGLLIDGHAAVETIEFKNDQIRDPAFMKSEAAKKKEQGSAYKATAVADIPKIDGIVAERSINHPSSGYSALAERIADKLAKYKPSAEDLKAAEGEAVEAV